MTKPSLRRPSRIPVGPEQQLAKRPPLLSPEFLEEADRIIGGFSEYMKSGGRTAALAKLETHAFSVRADAERNELVSRLSEKLGIDVDLRLQNAEHTWRERGSSPILVEPWMKRGLGMNNPDEPALLLLPGNAKREIVLAIDDNNLAYWMHELEIPSTVIGPDGEQEGLSRVIYFSVSQMASP